MCVLLNFFSLTTFVYYAYDNCQKITVNMLDVCAILIVITYTCMYIACAGHIFLQSAVIMIILQTIIMFITQHILFVSRQQYTSQVGLNIIYQLTRLKNIYNFVSSRTLSSQLIHAGQRRNLKHR